MSVVTVLVLAAAGLYVYKSLQPKDTSYTVSGRILCGGLPVSGITVVCEIGETVTDENGEFFFEGVDGSVTIRVQDDRYFFKTESVTIDSEEAVAFEGIAYRPLEGFVISDSVAIEGAVVEIVAENGAFLAYSDENGKFTLPKVAGEVTVTATKDGMTLFGSTLKPNEEEVVVTAKTDFSGSFVFEEGVADFGGISVYLDGAPVALSDNSFYLKDLDYNAELSFVSEKYELSCVKHVVTAQNTRLTVYAYEKYEVKGKLVCGGVPLVGRTVFLDGKSAVTTEADGAFVLTELFGSHEVSFEEDGFDGATVSVDRKNTYAGMSVRARAYGIVAENGKGVRGIEVKSGSDTAVTNADGRFALWGAYGEEIKAVTSAYHVENAPMLEQDQSLIVINVQKYYKLTVSVTDDGKPMETEVLLNGKPQRIDGSFVWERMYGEANVSFCQEGYESLQEVASASRNEISFAPIRLLCVTGKLTSGELTLDGVVSVGEVSLPVTDGEFTVDRVAEGSVVTVLSEGYSSFSKTVTRDDCVVYADLTYSVTLRVATDVTEVSGFTVKGVAETVEATERAVFDGLRGAHTFTFAKNGYDISSVSVVKSGDYTAKATYSIGGQALKDGIPLSGYMIYLVDVESADGKMLSVETDQNGRFSFESLASKYRLFSQNSGSVTLKPGYYTVTAGGVYDFSNSGYSFSGSVTVGTRGLSGVKVTAGESETVTDESGAFRFELLSSDCVLTFSKQGYAFEQNGTMITEEMDGKTLAFSASYAVSGKIVSGVTPLAGVSVSVAGQHTVSDESGVFAFDGITAENAVIVAEKEGWRIDAYDVIGYADVTLRAYAKISFLMTCGDLPVEGVAVTVGGKNATEFQMGDVVSFSKEGYEFPLHTVGTPGEFVVNGSYSVKGEVKNGDFPIADALIVLNGEAVTKTDANGAFSIGKMQGSNTLTAKVDGYEFAVKTISSPCTVMILSSYSVSVTVRSARIPVSGVAVTIGDAIGVTNENGEVRISGVTGKQTAKAEKEGYEFTGKSEVSGAAELAFAATYSVNGVVTVSGAPKAGVSVQSGSVSTQSDADGAFVLRGIAGEATVVVQKEGYKTVSFTVTEPTEEAVAMAFSVTLTFNGVDANGIVICRDGEKWQTVTSSPFTLPYLSEAAELSFEKPNVRFTPAVVTVSDRTTLSVKGEVVYSVSGSVKTESGIPVVGMTLVAGNKPVVTDRQGAYKIDNLIGKVQISGGTFGVTLNGVTYETINGCVIAPKTVEGESVVNFTVTDAEYGWVLFKRGYANLDHAKSYEIYGNGAVNPSMGGAQTVFAVNKKDENGNRLNVNQNYGDEILGIDPKVSLLAFYNEKASAVQYKKVTGSAVKDSTTAVYTSLEWTHKTPAAFKDYLGTSITGYLPYNINESTVTGFSGFAVNGDSIQMTMTLAHGNSATWSAYKKQMEVLSGVVPKSFGYIRLKFTYNLDGVITALTIEEQYVVNKVVDVTINAKLNYDFYLYVKTAIPVIDVSSEAQIQASIKKYGKREG